MTSTTVLQQRFRESFFGWLGSCADQNARVPFAGRAESLPQFRHSFFPRPLSRFDSLRTSVGRTVLTEHYLDPSVFAFATPEVPGWRPCQKRKETSWCRRCRLRRAPIIFCLVVVVVVVFLSSHYSNATTLTKPNTSYTTTKMQILQTFPDCSGGQLGYGRRHRLLEQQQQSKCGG